MELGLNYIVQYSNKQGQTDNLKNLLSNFIALQCNKYVDISSRFNFQKNIELQQFIDQNITTINESQFFQCRGLRLVSFPACTSIRSSAFDGCLLQSINFPACTSIGDCAFEFCYQLPLANFPSCTLIGKNAFYQCSSLQTVSFSVCTSIGSSAFQNCTSLQLVDFPSCDRIFNAAFSKCTSLKIASFPKCTTIRSSAFYNCNSLSALYLLGSSVCALSAINAFQYTPMSLSSYLGYFGSIYVPSSLVSRYKTATNWTYYANRITSYIE